MNIIFILELPLIGHLSFTSDSVAVGEYRQLTCAVLKGDMPVQFIWFLNDEIIESSLGISLTNLGRQTSILIIQNVNFNHSGRYTCSVRNVAGQANATAQLLVKGIYLYCVGDVNLPLNYT